MIPRLIHQTWRSKILPGVYKGIYDHNRSMQDGYEMMLWSHSPGAAEIDHLLQEHYPDLYSLFLEAKFGVQKGDIARLAILHHFGGIYMDLDVLTLHPLSTFICPNSNALHIAYEPEEQVLHRLGKSAHMGNAFIAAPAGHPVIKAAIDLVILLRKEQGESIFYQSNAFGGAILQHIIECMPSLVNIIDTHKVYPINNPELHALPTLWRDWERLRTGTFARDVAAVHFWMHGDENASDLMQNFPWDKSAPWNDNVFTFFKKLYPHIYNYLGY